MPERHALPRPKQRSKKCACRCRFTDDSKSARIERLNGKRARNRAKHDSDRGECGADLANQRNDAHARRCQVVQNENSAEEFRLLHPLEGAVAICKELQIVSCAGKRLPVANQLLFVCSENDDPRANVLFGHRVGWGGESQGMRGAGFNRNGRFRRGKKGLFQWRKAFHARK